MATPTFQRAFGERVRALRKARGYSQEVFAAHANLDRSAYGKLERGEINVGFATLARMAVALQLTLSQLLEGIELDAAEVRALPRSQRGPHPMEGRDSTSS